MTLNTEATAIIGVDPGKFGGLQIIVQPSESLHTLPMDNNMSQVSNWISSILEGYPNHSVYAYIEKQWSRPLQDVKKGDILIINYAKILGMLETMKIPVFLVAPQTWKTSVLGDANATKKAAIDFCKATYNKEYKLAEDGLSDALCIAHYGLQQIRNYEGNNNVKETGKH